MGIEALKKAQGVWCAHCAPGKGCNRYSDRPQECVTFNCAWLIDEKLGEEWYPKKSRIVLTMEPDRIIAHVDPGTPDVWRRQPYYGVLHQMMQTGLQRGRLVYVALNAHHILLLPDREEDLGVLGPADEVELATVARPAGMEYRVSVRRPGA